MDVPHTVLARTVAIAIAEDLEWGDLTTAAIIDPTWRARGVLRAHAGGVVCGNDAAREVLRQIDESVSYREEIRDGGQVRAGATIATVEGAAASILMGERTALNFLQHLSGIATITSRYVEALAEMETRIVETRKTLPGLRALEKYAVRVGGGANHRLHLGDGVLIKDNHRALLRAHGVGLNEAVVMARRRASHVTKIEIEADSLAEVSEALEAGADVILLDNMSPEDLDAAYDLVAGRAVLEASGGVTIDSLRVVAGSGVDIVSVGALTHSARALDIGLDLEPL